MLRSPAEDSPKDPAVQVLALVRDLMFASRITAAGRSQGVSVRLLREPGQLDGVPGRLLLVDLNQDGTIPAAAAWKQRTQGQVVGFVSHVDTATIETARAAGIDRIMARSGFVAGLNHLLAPTSPTSPPL
jgi:hypothetical protein